MKNNKFKVGDLVRLKGFKRAKPEDVPYGMVIVDNYPFHNGRMVPVKWLNKNVADRYVLKSYIEIEKLEILQKAQSDA